VLNPPVPKPVRFWKMGRALRKAIESYPEDIKVAIAGTGGLSHQVHGERCGFINTPWDMEFLERLEKDPEGLTKVTVAEYAKLGGMEGAEVVMWLLMRGALSDKVKKVHQTYYVPSMTAISSVIFENDSVDAKPESDEAFRTRMMSQYAGIEKLEGTYPYTIERSVKAFRLNRFLHSLVRPEVRKQFLKDPQPLFEQNKLTAEERRLITERDWRGLMHYGAIFFVLEKFAAVIGSSNLHVYAAMRGQSLEDFMKTRNTQVLYSVAGTDQGKTDWDKKTGST
jgi:gallate dioxygenase